MDGYVFETYMWWTKNAESEKNPQTRYSARELASNAMQWTALHDNAMQRIGEQRNAMEYNVTQCHAKHNTNTRSHCRKDISKRNVTRLHNTHYAKLNTNTHNPCDNQISEKMLFDCTTHNTQNITQIHTTIAVMKFPRKCYWTTQHKNALQ